jgi:hypothetical protein
MGSSLWILHRGLETTEVKGLEGSTSGHGHRRCYYAEILWSTQVWLWSRCRLGLGPGLWLWQRLWPRLVLVATAPLVWGWGRLGAATVGLWFLWTEPLVGRAAL